MRTMLIACSTMILAGSAEAARVAVDPAIVRERIESTIAERLGDEGTFEVLELPRLAGEAGEVTVEVLLPGEFHRPGPRAITVQCRSGGRVTARGLASVLVRVTRSVWIPTEPLKRGEVLDPNRLDRELKRFEREPLARFVLEPQARYRLVRDVEPGVALRASDVRRLHDVETGDEIRLVSRAGQAAVYVVGRVRRGGMIGESILVLNPLTGKIVRATLVDPETARLEALSENPSAERQGPNR